MPVPAATNKRPSRKEYRRVRNDSPKEKGTFPENEIRVVATHGQRNYIRYCIDLLTGANEKTKHDSVIVSAMGRAIFNAVNIAEVLKHRVLGLHQVTDIGTENLTDEYEAIEKGKDNLEISRRVSTISIVLSTKALDKSHIGYQAPPPDSEVTPEDPNHEPPPRRRGGRGGRRGGFDDGQGGRSGNRGARPQGRGGFRGGRGGRDDYDDRPYKKRTEDAFFTSNYAMGVADGVGGWAEKGVDPSLYSRKLMSRALAAALAHKRANTRARPKDSQRVPLRMMNSGYDACLQARVVGSATCCIAALVDDAHLSVLNVGDSGLRLFRDGKMVFATVEGCKECNWPDQIGTFCTTTPKDGQSSLLAVQEGDIVLMASDGVFDNVYDEDLIKLVEPLRMNTKNENGDRSEENISISQICKEICRFAERLSKTFCVMSPFASRAKANGYANEGGKSDDITVVLAVITANEQWETVEGKHCPLLIEDIQQEGLPMANNLIMLDDAVTSSASSTSGAKVNKNKPQQPAAQRGLTGAQILAMLLDCDTDSD